MERAAWRVALGVTAAAGALAVLGSGALFGLPVVLLAGVLAVAGVALGLRLHRLGRPLPRSGGSIEPWILLGCGLIALVGGEVARTIAGADSHTLSAPASLVALAGYPATVAGLLRLIQGRRPGREGDMLIEAGLTAVAFGLCTWALLFRDQAPNVGFLTALLGIAVPAGDAAVAVLMARLAGLPGERPEGYGYLAVGFLSLLAAHSFGAMTALQGLWLSPALIRLLTVMGFGCWAAAALHPSMQRLFEPLFVDPPKFSRTHLALVGVALVTPALIALRIQPRGVSLTIPVGSAIFSILLAAYMADLLWDRANIEHRAEHDPLTGLPNRALLYDRLNRALAHAHRSQGSLAVLFIDLDHFKQINDSLGHSIGDDLLKGMARRLAASLREEDTVARLGGDEFAVLLPHLTTPTDGVKVAEKLVGIISSPFEAGGHTLRITPSIGVAIYPSDGDHTEQLLTNADTAMYRAKERGRQTFEVYSPALHARVQQRLEVEANLQAAIDNDELVLHFQPKVSLRTGRLVGAEALVRWRHPERGLLAPAHFIPLAEETGLVVPLGEKVLELACRQSAEWSSRGLPSLQMAVNLSPHQFHGSPVADMVASALRRYGLREGCLELEITESAALEHPEATVATLQEIKGMGVRCSIDDFGTGYSSLSHLIQLPIDSVKIDQSFVQQVHERAGASIVVAVMAMSHSLGLEVIAEGVETEEQLEFLRRAGCDQIQGYLFSPPLVASEFERLVLDHTVLGPGQLPLWHRARAGNPPAEQEHPAPADATSEETFTLLASRRG